MTPEHPFQTDTLPDHNRRAFVPAFNTQEGDVLAYRESLLAINREIAPLLENEFTRRDDYPSREQAMEKTRDVHPMLVSLPTDELLDQKVVIPPGILWLSKMLEDNNNSYSLLDLAGDENWTDILLSSIDQQNPDCLCFSVTVAQIGELNTAIEAVRQRYPDMKIILGGPMVTSVTGSAITNTRENDFDNNPSRACRDLNNLLTLGDVLVAGDGPGIFLAMDEDFEGQIVDASNRNSPFYIKGREIDNFGSSMDALEYFIQRGYRFRVNNVPAIVDISQLGCNDNCSFCALRRSVAEIQTGNVIRAQTPDVATDRLKDMFWLHHNLGAHASAVMDYSDEFNLLPRRTKNYCVKFADLRESLAKELLDRYGDEPHLLEQMGYEIVNERKFPPDNESEEMVDRLRMPLRFFSRVDMLTAEQAKLLKWAGAEEVLLGEESGSQEILARMNKRTSPSQIRNAVDVAHNAGLNVKHLIMIGYTDTAETIQETIDMLSEPGFVRPGDNVDISLFNEVPGSDIYTHCQFGDDGLWHVGFETADGFTEMLIEDTDYLASGTGSYKTYEGLYRGRIHTNSFDKNPEEESGDFLSPSATLHGNTAVTIREQMEQKFRAMCVT